jgi:hypothetical protein
MDFTALFKEFVFPVAISIVLLWFILREVWQFIVKQIQQINADRTTEREEFLRSLQALTTMAEQQHMAANQQQAAITQQLGKLNDAIAQIIRTQA